MIRLADALVPAGFGRVMVHNVVVAKADWKPEEDDEPIKTSQALLSEMLRASVRMGIGAESLTTVAPESMEEIARVVKLHRCEPVLLGLSNFSDESDGASLEWLLSTIAPMSSFFRPVPAPTWMKQKGSWSRSRAEVATNTYWHACWEVLPELPNAKSRFFALCPKVPQPTRSAGQRRNLPALPKTTLVRDVIG